MGMGSPTGSNNSMQQVNQSGGGTNPLGSIANMQPGQLSRPNSQPAPTQQGFATMTQMPAGQQPLDVFHRPPTQQGFATMTQPPAGGLGSLQQYGQAGGFNPQFGGFGNQNPQNQQYHQYMDAWRNQRPEMQPGMDHNAFRQQMDAWHGMRPDRNNMPAPGYIPQQVYLSDGPNMPHGVGEPMPPQQNAQLAPFVSTYNQLQNSAGNQAQQAQLLSQYNQMLQSVGMPTMSMGGPGITPDAVAQKLGTGAPSGATPVAGQQAALQNAYQDFLQQKQLGSAAPAGAPPAPMQAVMPPAPNTQQIGREDPRMQAMRAMQMFANQRRGG